jgi:hypothetical protein
MSYELPPILKLSQRLLLEIEQAVKRFAKYHRYTVGTKLRDQAWEVRAIAERAWRDKSRQAQWVSDLVWAVDELKFGLQLGKEIKAFISFAQFENLARLAADLVKQVGGWFKQQHPKGQNGVTVNSSRQRPTTLSTRAASCEANS